MINERIRELREKNDLTQTMLAKRLGLSRSAVNAWEMGISIPSTQYIVQLAGLFNVSTDYLLCIDKEEKIDISDLMQHEKEIIYSLLNYFKNYRYAIELLHKNGIVHPNEDYEELYYANINLPKNLKPTIEKMINKKKN